MVCTTFTNARSVPLNNSNALNGAQWDKNSKINEHVNNKIMNRDLNSQSKMTSVQNLLNEGQNNLKHGEDKQIFCHYYNNYKELDDKLYIYYSKYDVNP